MAAPITLWPWVLGAWATSAYVRMFEQGRGMPGMLQLCFNKNVPSLLWNVEHNWACQDLSKPRKRNMHNAKIRPICFGKKSDLKNRRTVDGYRRYRFLRSNCLVWEGQGHRPRHGHHPGRQIAHPDDIWKSICIRVHNSTHVECKSWRNKPRQIWGVPFKYQIIMYHHYLGSTPLIDDKPLTRGWHYLLFIHI